MEEKSLTLTQQEKKHCIDEHGLALDSFGGFMYMKGMKDMLVRGSVAFLIGVGFTVTVELVTDYLEERKHNRKKK